MTVLELLATCIEHGQISIAPAMAEEATRKRLDGPYKVGADARPRANRNLPALRSGQRRVIRRRRLCRVSGSCLGSRSQMAVGQQRASAAG
jgi:hypothetical protein